MGYNINLQAINLAEYKNELITGYLPPSRMLLKNDIDKQFEKLGYQGIDNAWTLLLALKTKNRILQLAAKSGIPAEYLVILSREIRSLVKKPIALGSFTSIDRETLGKLSDVGIKNTKDIYDKGLTKKNRAALAQGSGVEEEEILRIVRLADLSRIRWVNHTFSQILLELGFTSAKKVAKADHEKLHRLVNDLNKQKGVFKGSVGLNDIRICIKAALSLDHELK